MPAEASEAAWALLSAAAATTLQQCINIQSLVACNVLYNSSEATVSTVLTSHVIRLKSQLGRCSQQYVCAVHRLEAAFRPAGFIRIVNKRGCTSLHGAGRRVHIRFDSEAFLDCCQYAALLKVK